MFPILSRCMNTPARINPDVAGFPRVAAWWTFILIDMVWGSTVCVLSHRYK